MDRDLFDRLVKKRMDNNFFVNYAGIELVEVKEDRARVSLKLEKRHLNPHLRAHGGILMTMADAAMGLALVSLNEVVTTVDINYRFLRPAYEGDLLTCQALQIKKGRSLVVLESSIYRGDELIGKADATFIRLGKKIIDE